jgi:ApaG protein
VKSFFPYCATTRGVTVRVAVSFLPEQSEPGKGRWFWAYHIRIENEGERAVQLISREWSIVDGRGGRHEVQGDGVVGEQPVIDPDTAFDYVSGCPLNTPTGFMEGRYHMIAEDGSSFAVTIPRFPLLAPAVVTNISRDLEVEAKKTTYLAREAPEEPRKPASVPKTARTPKETPQARRKRLEKDKGKGPLSKEN